MKLAIILLPLTLALLAGTGCVSAKYKPAPKDTPPPVALNLTSAPAKPAPVFTPANDPSPTEALPTIVVTVHSVISFRGPGSWKRDAYWDEYVVSVVNRGADPLVVESAILTDFEGDATEPGINPWLLEKQSRLHVDELQRDHSALVQVGGGFATVMAGSFLGVASLGGGSAAAGTWAAGIVGAAVIPIYIGGAIYRNVSSRHDIEGEFARRRLVLGGVVAPGSTVSGSLFFRISPGPQRLVLHSRVGGEPRDLGVDLAPLAGLHLNVPAAAQHSRP